MKVAVIGPANCIHVVRWVNAISDRGIELTLLTMHSPIQKLNKNIKMIKLPFKAPLGYYLNTFELRKILKSLNPDVIHVHQASGHGTLARLGSCSNYLLSVYGADVIDFPFKSKYKFNVTKKNLLSASIVASTSHFMANHVKNTFQYEKNIPVTPFGVDTERFKPINKEYHGTIKIGIVKRLEEKYGIEYLIKGFELSLKRLKEKGENNIADNLELVIVGSGSLRKDLEDLSKKLEIDDKINFVGRVNNEDVPKYLNSFDVFCVPSILDSESFGVAAVEASACGLPVIASRVGGLQEVIDDGVTGYLVEKKNYEEISDKILDLILNPELAKKMGIKGREKVENLYNWSENVSEVIRLYELIMNN